MEANPSLWQTTFSVILYMITKNDVFGTIYIASSWKGKVPWQLIAKLNQNILYN